MSKGAIAVVCAPGLLALAPGAQAELYKCVGPGGKISYTDSPCDGSAPVTPKRSEPEEMPKGPSAEERDRLKTLDAITIDPKTTNEQKTAAQLEAGNIRRGLEASLSTGDKARREALTRELANPDKDKLARALRELRTLYRE